MKLSVSAYRAHSSAHQKILSSSNYQTLLNYGSTSTSAAQPLVRGLPSLKVEEVEGGASPSPHQQHQQQPPAGQIPQEGGMVDSSGTGAGAAAAAGDGGGGSSASGSSPATAPSLATSREEDGEADGDDSKRDSAASSDRSPGQSTDADHEASCSGVGRPPSLASRDRSRSVGEQKWRNVRAVMALYTRLRKIKRTKSNQRWLKLRTTVQLSSAISTSAQKKPPLKREDSFLKRFSTRQIPETQETVDTGDDGDGGSSPTGDATPTRRRRRRRGPQRLPRSVVNPDENFYFYWLMLLTVCVLYNLWTLIVRQSFPELQQRAPAFWLSCDSISDAVFLLDVAVQFRTGYLEQGLMVYDSKKLAGHYLRSRAFLLDLSALLPLDLLQINLGTNPILRFPRFLKVYRVYDYYYMVESRTVYPNLWRVVNLIHILMILAHWFGCFYYLLSEAEEFQGDWVYPYRPGEYATLTRKYLGSLYWSTLTLTTIGDLPTPESNLEYIFTIVSYLIGVFIFATIVGQVGNVITNRNANRLEFERLLDGAKTYMRHHKVPGGMKRRVLRWYDYSWSRGRIQGGGDINTALGLLPDKLKTELALHVNLSVLKKVTIFQECQPEFLHDLVLKMKAYIFTPGDIICRKGEVAREMFIIADGILEVISETGRVLTTMKAGDFFGEIGILNLDGLNKRTADVRSVGYSELFSLSREDVLAAMKDYPEAQEILQNLGRKRLMEARNMNKPKAVAGHGSGHGRHGEHGGHGDAADDSAGRRIVDRLRSDVKGLKNALRKSRRGHRTNDESLELQPLNPEGGPAVGERHGSTKAVLRRMSRVRSDEADDIAKPAADHHQQGASLVPGAQPLSPSEKLGAGLPLLQRLRMLKEKQEREERKLLPASPPSPPPAPAPVAPAAPGDRPATPEREHEVVGAGLPLLQRLKLLKQKEDRAASASASAAAAAAAATAAVAAPASAHAACSRGPSLSPPATADDSRLHSGPSSEEEAAAPPQRRAAAAAGSILTRLASLKHAGRQPSVASSTASSDRHSDAESAACGPLSPTEALSPPARAGSLLLRDRLRTLVHAPALAAASHTPPHTPPPPPQPQPPPPPTAVALAIAATAVVAPPAGDLQRPPPVKKQPSWTILKRAAIVSSSGSREDESSDASAVSAPAALDRTAAEGGDADVDAASHLAAAASPADAPTSPARHQDVGDEKPSVPAATGAAGEDESWRPSVEMASPPPASVGRPPPPGAEADPQPPPTCVAAAANTTPAVPLKRPAKPSLLQIQQRETKFYTSIDDLSPEYSGLPFVKKLKILNERQKLAELERTVAAAGFLRSSSLDSGGAAPGCLDSGLTRSHSEATAMQYVRSQQLGRDGAPPAPPSPQRQPPLTPTSPESNETPERRNLKSILKKLSAGSLFSAVPPPAAAASPPPPPPHDDPAAARAAAPAAPADAGRDSPPVTAAPVCSPTAAAKQHQMEMRKLMRAPTVEGYAARHSKLTKSVTFNRDTLQSPPASPPASPVVAQQPPAQTGPHIPTTTAEDNRLITPPPPVVAQKKPAPPPSVLAANQKNFLGTSLLLSQNGDEEFFGDIISGIKQVIQGHLEDIQNKFQSRFQSLELEVRRRDEIIQQLQKRIHELENPPQGDTESHPLVPNGGEESSSDQSDADDQPFMRGDSVDTVLGSPESSRPRNRHEQAPSATGRCRPRPPSWDEVSREERVELGVLPPPVPLPVPLPPAPKRPSWRQESISVDLGSSSEDSSETSSSGAEEEGFDQRAGVSWEVQMLAREMERQEQEQQRITNSELNMLQRLVDEHHPEVPASLSGMRAQSFEYPPHQQRMPLRAQLSTNGCPYEGSAQHTPVSSADPTLRSLPPVPPRGQPYVPSDT